jgi:cysteine synthase A
MRIASSITELIGKTPLVQLNRVTKDCLATVVTKLEFFNPGSSVKDRIGLAMIEQGKNTG